MFKTLTSGLRALRTGTAGKRFQQRYHRRREAGHHTLRKYSRLVGGGFIMAAGVFFMPAPGPGMVILFLGATLVARESLLAARGLDWTELKLRQCISGARKFWKQAGLPVKILLVLVLAAGMLATVFVSWKLLLPLWRKL